MPEAMQTAYRSSSPEIQNKIRRVIEVWRTRNVFEIPIQDAIESRLEEIDKSKGISGKKTLMGKSLFESSSSTGIPKELESLGPLQIALSKANLTARPAIDAAQNEYTKLNDPDATLPSPPVYAARLSSLMKALANAETSVSASIQARQALVTDLQRILEINRAGLTKDEETYEDLSSRRLSTEAKKREVEDSIMRGLASAETGPEAETIDTPDPNNGMYQPSRPDYEELTPEPDDLPGDLSFGAQPQPLPSIPDNPDVRVALAGFASPNPRVRQLSSDQGANGSSAKRRKTDHGEEVLVPDLGAMQDLIDADLDQDVNDLIRQESAV